MECHASNSKRRGSVTIMECYIYIIALGIKSNHTALFIWADAYTVAILHRHRSKARSASIRNVVSLPSSSLTAAEAFVLGAISKMVATVATYPLQLAQVLLRLQSKNDADDFDKDESSNEPNEDNGQSNKNTKAYKGMIDCLHQQFTQGGIRGLFQGMNAKLLSTVLTAAFTFLSYEQTLQLVGKVHQALLNDV